MQLKKKKKTHRGNKKRGKKRSKKTLLVNVNLGKSTPCNLEVSAAGCTHHESVIEVDATTDNQHTNDTNTRSMTPSNQKQPPHTPTPTGRGNNWARMTVAKRYTAPAPNTASPATFVWESNRPQQDWKTPQPAPTKTQTQTTKDYQRTKATEAEWTMKLKRARKQIWQDQLVIEEIFAQNWEIKRLLWVDQCNRAIAKVQNDVTLMEHPNSDLFFPRFSELKHLPPRERYWIWVLVGSGRVELVESPMWANITELHSHRSSLGSANAPQMHAPMEFALTFRFGFHLETIMDAVIVGLQKTISSTWTCRNIAEYVGPSRFFCSVRTRFSRSDDPWWIQKGTIQINHLWDLGGKY